MKTVHVETGRHFYGGAQQVIWLLKGLIERDVESLLVCPPDSDIDTAAREAGIPVANVACSGDHDLRFIWRLRSLLRREKPDIVHCHSRRGADFLGGQAALMAGIPAVVSRRVDNPESPFMSRLRYRPFRKIVAISENIGSLLTGSGLDPARLCVIRSAVDVDAIDASPDCGRFRDEFGIEESDFTIAVVAQLIARKGHRFVLDVLPGLREHHPGIRVVFFGTGRAESGIRSLTRKLGVADMVQFAGFRADLDSYLACFDLLVHPALQEGLGVAMLKGAAAGLPVIAFDAAGAGEAVLHGKTGALIPPGDMETLQDAIALMIEEPDMGREFGQAGRTRMRDEFSVETMVESHIELYDEVLNV